MIREMTDKQRALIEKICTELGKPEAATAFFASRPTMSLASSKISALIDESRAARAARPVAVRPAAPALIYPEPGYYAVHYGDRLNFYRVKDGKGRWAGQRFINRYKSDYLDRLDAVERRAVVELIESDPETAMLRFAKELTRCYCCGRMLTDETSRLIGQGPECRKGRKVAVGGVGDLDDLV
jgi:hypothetical protein